MYHFSEQIKDEKFYFDYKIKSGACTSGNAIKLLELMNYPKSITDEAHSIAHKFNQNYKLNQQNIFSGLSILNHFVNR